MKIYIGADHQGFVLKESLIEHLRRLGHEVVDKGDKLVKPDDDFPQFAARVVSALLADDRSDARGILICGSGQGMAIAANRFKGIRACVVWDVPEARTSRNDDDANILCLPARLLKTAEADQVVTSWLNTPFAGASRFKRRLKELDELT
jgi:ribose 5-phosphate isomerase B